MQAIKEKLNDMGAMRKAKAEAKEEEKAEKELAKARVEVAHEVRLAREAQAAVDLHANKAAEKAAEEEMMQAHHSKPANAAGVSPGATTEDGCTAAACGAPSNRSSGHSGGFF